MIQLNNIATEKNNPATKNIDTMSTMDMLSLINQEDQKVAMSVQAALPQIAKAVDWITDSLKAGGRLFYAGAGTSGRLGVLDASECPPTFGVEPSLVQALMAGGHKAMFVAQEGAEDSPELCKEALQQAGFSNKDILVAIAASGRTPYAIGGLEYANSLGAKSIALVCSASSPMSKTAQHTICVEPGPEVITGSTRLKAGTAQKLVLNMLSTGTMIKMGKVYGNLMVDLKATNQKLRERSIKIVMQAADCTRTEAEEALKQAQNHTKLAIFMLLSDKPAPVAQQLLTKANGYISLALKNLYHSANITKGE